MVAREFKPMLAPSEKPHQHMTTKSPTFLFTTSLKPRTIVLCGALLQILLSTLFPLRWAIVPALALLLNSIIRTLLQLRSPSANSFAAHVIPGRATAQLPDTATGTFGPLPADRSVVVFNLGIQWNHPLGALAPSVRAISNQYMAMVSDLHRRRDELGLLDLSNWTGRERSSNQSLHITFYFRDIESVHRFAHEELHRRAWDSYNAAKPAHVGIYHEAFVVPARSYETMYVNCHPVGLGRGEVRCETKADGARWLNTLVSADTPALKTQYARLSRHEDGTHKE